MYRLSDRQIDYILNDISARGVEMESLQQNLLDHVCCIIENNLEENGDFERFYQKTIKTFYKDALWEIEEETLQLLTFKNYYTMKKIMIYSGILSVIGFIAGSILKIMHWPAAGAVLVLSMAVISLVFLPLLLILKAKEAGAIKEKLMIGAGTIFGILFGLSSLFKIMHWPRANTMWLIALAVLLFIFIPLYFFFGIRNPETKVNTIITTIILISAGGMLFTMTSLKTYERTLHSTQIEVMIQNEELIDSEANYLYKIAEPDTSLNKPLNRAREINKICNELKSELLESETGYEKFTSELIGKKIIVTNRLASVAISTNKEFYEKKIHKLNALLGDQNIYRIIEETKLTKKAESSHRKSIIFSSKILLFDPDFIEYNNTVIGLYTDIQEIQLNAIEDLKELVELKHHTSQITST